METLLSFFSNIDWYEIWLASIDTLIMLGGSLLFTVLLGLPLGILLFLCSPRQLLEQKALYSALSFVVNILRSLPFIILLVVMIPFTVLITGTSLGVAAWSKRRFGKWTAASSKPLRQWAPTRVRSLPVRCCLKHVPVSLRQLR